MPAEVRDTINRSLQYECTFQWDMYASPPTLEPLNIPRADLLPNAINLSRPAPTLTQWTDAAKAVVTNKIESLFEGNGYALTFENANLNTARYLETVYRLTQDQSETVSTTTFKWDLYASPPTLGETLDMPHEISLPKPVNLSRPAPTIAQWIDVAKEVVTNTIQPVFEGTRLRF